VVLNAAGPRAERLLGDAKSVRLQPQGVYSRDACFVVPRKLAGRYALAVQGRASDPDALMGRPARHLFIVPWRDYSMIGVWHVVYDRHPSDVTITADELQSFIDEINWAHPPLQLTLDEVRIWNAGLVPFGENEPGAENLSYGKRSYLVDHADTHGVEGLVTLIGIRFTMARGDAARAIDLAASKIGRGGSSRPATDTIPVHGGDIEDFERLVREIMCRDMPGLDERVARALAHNHGTEYPVVLGYAKAESALSGTIGESTVLRAEVANAIDNEMVHSLSDIVFRRTDLATAGDPGRAALHECAAIAAARLGWDTVRVQEEMMSVTARFPAHHQSGPQVEIDAPAAARQ
jgi:glycerol-3-phosphate dehydrogenase